MQKKDFRDEATKKREAAFYAWDKKENKHDYEMLELYQKVIDSQKRKLLTNEELAKSKEWRTAKSQADWFRILITARKTAFIAGQEYQYKRDKLSMEELENLRGF